MPWIRLGPAQLDVHADIGEILAEVALVGRHGVIAVHAVFDQELPVRLHAVGLRAVHDLGVLAAEFAHQVEILARVAEIAGQAFDRAHLSPVSRDLIISPRRGILGRGHRSLQNGICHRDPEAASVDPERLSATRYRLTRRIYLKFTDNFSYTLWFVP